MSAPPEDDVIAELIALRDKHQAAAAAAGRARARYESAVVAAATTEPTSPVWFLHPGTGGPLEALADAIGRHPTWIASLVRRHQK